MGGARQSSSASKSPPGVEVRRWKSGKETLRINFYYRGFQCRETLNLPVTKANINYASRLRGEIINAIEKGTFSYKDYFPDSNLAVRFGHASEKRQVSLLLDDFLAQAKTATELSTYIGYKKICNAHLYPKFGHLAIQELKPAVLRPWIRSLQVTAKTVSNILLPLRAIVEQALNDELIESNPFDKIAVGKLINARQSKSDFKVDPFTFAEINQILAAPAHEQIQNLFQFAFFTGLRTSELIGLEWRDVDWNEKIIHVVRAVVKKQVKYPKTRAGEREVKLLPPALEALERQKIHTMDQGLRVFHNPRTDAPWETDHQIRRTAWIPALKKSGVRYRNPYQTRHTYASMMLSRGERISWIVEQMGHVDPQMLMRTYGKWIPDSGACNGYKPVNDWEALWESNKPAEPPQVEKKVK